jgi:hypothetical protein
MDIVGEMSQLHSDMLAPSSAATVTTAKPQSCVAIKEGLVLIGRVWVFEIRYCDSGRGLNNKGAGVASWAYSIMQYNMLLCLWRGGLMFSFVALVVCLLKSLAERTQAPH